MTSDLHVKELEGNLKALTELRDELAADMPVIEEVTQTNAAIKELRQVLEETGGDAEAVKEKLGEYAEKLENLGGEIKEIVNDPKVKELTEGVGSGLEEFAGALENVNETLEPLEQAIELLQTGLEKSEASAEEQIEALAETLESVVDQLGPLIDRIPGLGAFFQIYAEAIKQIALSVGKIQATQRSLQRIWAQLFPGTTMYNHARSGHEIRQQRLQAIQLEIDRRVNELVDIAEERRTAIPDDQMTEVDIAVRAAMRDCQELMPPADAPELRARDDAWRALEQADDARSLAQANYDAAAAEAEAAAIDLETATGSGRARFDVGAAEASARSTAAAADRALETLRAREADQAAARSRYDEAQANWDAARQPYDDCMKSRLQQLGQYANQEQGFTDEDLRYLEIMYPQFALPAEEGATQTPAPSEPAPGEAVESPQKEPVEVSSSAIFGFPRRIVIGGGGGILAMAMVGVVVVFGGGGDDGPTSGGGETGGGGSSVERFAVADGTGDLVRTWDDFDPIESPNAAADVTEMQVEVDAGGNRTRITLSFAGDARSLTGIAGEELEADILIRPPDDGQIHNILLREDGSSKLSDPPSGMGVTSGWTDGGTLVFDVTGYAAPNGATVSLRTIQEYRGTFSSDELELTVDANGGDFVGTSDAFEGSGAPAASNANEPAATAAAGACETAHARQDIVQLSSPDVQPAIPAAYTRTNGQETGFATPRFEWGEMPPETTEIAVLIQKLTSARGEEYAQDSRLWWNQRPIGATAWLVTGIDAEARSLPVTSLTMPPPGNAVERPHENGRLTLGDDVYEQQFWITSGEPHLFTVFGLCDPPLAGTADDYNQVWLLRNAVAIGWFISALE